MIPKPRDRASQLANLDLSALVHQAPREEPPARIDLSHAALLDKIDGQLSRDQRALHERVEFGYFVPLLFASQTQADAFLEASGWRDCIEHNEYGFYLNGLKLAQHLGILLPPALATFTPSRIDQRLIDALGLQESLPDA